MTKIRGGMTNVDHSPESLIAAHGGDIRAAEAEAWEAWEFDGKKEHSPYKYLAIAIAEKKWEKKEETEGKLYFPAIAQMIASGRAPAGYVK